MDAHAGAAHRLLRAQLRALLRGLPHRRHLADYAQGKGLGGGRGRAEPAGPPGHRVLRPRPLPALGQATDCIVCEEWCPVSPKAIYVEEAQVVDSAGNIKTLKQPRVDPSRCVGCGACEYACPLQEHPAVYVTSIGESRSPSSQILLNRK